MFVYFNFLNSNKSLFYTLIKMIIYHLIKMTQRTTNKHNNKILTYMLYLLNSNIYWMVIKNIFMTITLNFNIVVNKSYLYNYSEKLQYDW